MKNKRTKFTAILLSALMAVSTVSSVTWAADLFSDGSDNAEAIVDESVDDILVVEDTFEADDAELTGVALTDIESVEFKYDNDKDPTKVVAVFKTKSSIGGKTFTVNAKPIPEFTFEATCTEPPKAIYRAEYHFEGDDVSYIDSKDDSAGSPKISINSVCGSWEYKDENEIKKPGTPINAPYIIMPGTRTTKTGTLGHKTSNAELSPVVYSSCSKKGLKLSYPHCSGCNALLNGSTAVTYDFGDGRGAVELKKPEDVLKAAQKSNPTYFVDENSDGIDGDDLRDNSEKADSVEVLVGGVTVTITASVLSEHNYDGQKSIVATQDYLNGISNKFPSLAKKFEPVNCTYSSGHWTVGDASKDAYYYEVIECKICGEPKEFKKVVLQDVSGSFSGTFYEEKENGNILGFVGMKGGIRVDILFTYYDHIPVDRPLQPSDYNSYNPEVGGPDGPLSGAVVLSPAVPIIKGANEDCEKSGYYYIRTYDSDSNNGLTEPVTEELKPVKGTHSWGNNEVAVAIDEKLGATATEEGKILKEGTKTDAKHSNGFLVVRDSNGDVTDVKSINCVTKAKYQLYHECYGCHKKEKVGDVKISSVNEALHQWPTLPDGDEKWDGPDDNDSKYYKIDENTHTKVTYLNRTCELCGKRETKPDKETIENHYLEEVKKEDGPSQEPNCGEDGYYTVHLACKCGLVDTGSEKRTVIPATDEHDFGDNKPYVLWYGTIQVGGRVKEEKASNEIPHIVYGAIVRDCVKCGKPDSNGIDTTAAKQTVSFNTVTFGPVGGTVIISSEGQVGGTLTSDSNRKQAWTFTDYVPAKVDPKTNVPYNCSVGSITANINWTGKVDGEAAKVVGTKEDIPYYINDLAFQGARAHKADDIRIVDKVDATTEAPGYYVQETYCSVCGEKVATETVEIAQIGSAPSVKTTVANYNTINISWDAVQDADYYILYYKSADLGVTTWKRVRTVNGTSFTHSGLVTGAKYRYTVRAVLDGVKGAYDRTGSVAIPKLAAPENINVTALSGKNKVSWNKVDGANGYIIQRSTGNGWTRVGSVKKGAKVTWTDKKPVSGATYRVRAYRTVNDANFSKNNVYSAFSAAK